MKSIIPRPPLYMNAELEKHITSGRNGKNKGIFRLLGDHSAGVIDLFQMLTARFDWHVQNIERLQYGLSSRKISYGWVVATDANAFSYASPEGESQHFDFVGINVGAVFTLNDLFMRILSHPDNFKDVGDPTLETPGRSKISHLSSDVFKSGFQPCFPLCPIREGFAGLLLQTALDFLFFHEIAHLRNGHLEFVKTRFLQPVLEDALQTSFSHEEKVLWQALEMDADCCAFENMIVEAFETKDLFLSGNFAGDDTQVSAVRCAFGDETAAINTVYFAAYMFFRICNSAEWDYFTQKDQSHPMSQVRMSWIAGTLFEIFKTNPRFRVNAMDAAHEMAQNAYAAEMACANILGDLPDASAIKSVVENMTLAADYLNSLSSAWSSMRPHLEKTKRCVRGLAP